MQSYRYVDMKSDTEASNRTEVPPTSQHSGDGPLTITPSAKKKAPHDVDPSKSSSVYEPRPQSDQRRQRPPMPPKPLDCASVDDTTDGNGQESKGTVPISDKRAIFLDKNMAKEMTRKSSWGQRKASFSTSPHDHRDPFSSTFSSSSFSSSIQLSASTAPTTFGKQTPPPPATFLRSPQQYPQPSHPPPFPLGPIPPPPIPLPPYGRHRALSSKGESPMFYYISISSSPLNKSPTRAVGSTSTATNGNNNTLGPNGDVAMVTSAFSKGNERGRGEPKRGKRGYSFKKERGEGGESEEEEGGVCKGSSRRKVDQNTLKVKSHRHADNRKKKKELVAIGRSKGVTCATPTTICSATTTAAYPYAATTAPTSTAALLVADHNLLPRLHHYDQTTTTNDEETPTAAATALTSAATAITPITMNEHDIDRHVTWDSAATNMNRASREENRTDEVPSSFSSTSSSSSSLSHEHVVFLTNGRKGGKDHKRDEEPSEKETNEEDMNTHQKSPEPTVAWATAHSVNTEARTHTEEEIESNQREEEDDGTSHPFSSSPSPTPTLTTMNIDAIKMSLPPTSGVSNLQQRSPPPCGRAYDMSNLTINGRAVFPLTGTDLDHQDGIENENHPLNSNDDTLHLVPGLNGDDLEPRDEDEDEEGSPPRSQDLKENICTPTLSPPSSPHPRAESYRAESVGEGRVEEEGDNSNLLVAGEDTGDTNNNRLHRPHHYHYQEDHYQTCDDEKESSSSSPAIPPDTAGAERSQHHYCYYCYREEDNNHNDVVRPSSEQRSFVGGPPRRHLFRGSMEDFIRFIAFSREQRARQLQQHRREVRRGNDSFVLRADASLRTTAQNGSFEDSDEGSMNIRSNNNNAAATAALGLILRRSTTTSSTATTVEEAGTRTTSSTTAMTNNGSTHGQTFSSSSYNSSYFVSRHQRSLSSDATTFTASASHSRSSAARRRRCCSAATTTTNESIRPVRSGGRHATLCLNLDEEKKTTAATTTPGGDDGEWRGGRGEDLAPRKEGINSRDNDDDEVKGNGTEDKDDGGTSATATDENTWINALEIVANVGSMAGDDGKNNRGREGGGGQQQQQQRIRRETSGGEGRGGTNATTRLHIRSGSSNSSSHTNRMTDNCSPPPRPLLLSDTFFEDMFKTSLPECEPRHPTAAVNDDHDDDNLQPPLDHHDVAGDDDDYVVSHSHSLSHQNDSMAIPAINTSTTDPIALAAEALVAQLCDNSD